MYKLSVPIMFRTFTEDKKKEIVESLKACQVERVFFGGLNYVFDPAGCFYSDEMKAKIDYLKSEGFEVGVWLKSFGHGDMLAYESGAKADLSRYTKVEGINGKNENSVCPYDKNVIAVFRKNIQRVASMKPDILMLDDDYRLNYRNYRMGCICENHLNEYYRRIGQVIPKEELEKKIFSGGRNFYRTQWLKLQGESLLAFAKEMRSAVDEVDPKIRMSACACWDTWDFEGTSCVEIARALAGNTTPYLRTIGAPYHKAKVSMTVETSRAQASWCRGRGIELFSEGDVYPRPRYNTPARLLELFDLGCIATGEFDGILKYMYDYVQPFGYETGYTDRHIRNKEIRTQLKEITKGKQATGIRVIDVMEKTENWHLPQNPPEEASAYLAAALENTRSAKCILTDNAIPTTYADTGAPVFVMGENAYYVEEADLRNGALLDISAAKILTERGFDVGLIGAKKADFTGESYIKENSTVSGFKNTELFRLVCKEGVQIETSLMPDKTPGSYRYENEKGQRFFVLAASLMGESYQPVVANANYTSNYYRKVQLTDAIEYVSGKKMVVKTTAKCPDLYMIALENEDRSALAVSVMNPFVDDAERVEFTLDKQYSSVRFIGCTGSLEGEKVIIDSIEPYGFAAFEIKL